MITKFENIKNTCPAKEAGLKVNDIITKVNDNQVKSNEALCEKIVNSQGKTINLTILRNNKELSINLTPAKDEDNKYKAGIWVRDSCAGMGTITYYDSTTSEYAGLGHGICDIDTGALMISDNIEIVKANITSVSKSTTDNIGTLNGYFTDEVLGTIGYNTELGIYGKVNTVPNKTEYKIAENDEIKIGTAYIYCTVEGTTPQKYEIQVVEICNNDKNSNKNFLIEVTDNELLSKTGGIVQGMSGSPIIQNNKIIGAITHVLVNDSTLGYGINISNMLNAS